MRIAVLPQWLPNQWKVNQAARLNSLQNPATQTT
jgi:hypothetical protein